MLSLQSSIEKIGFGVINDLTGIITQFGNFYGTKYGFKSSVCLTKKNTFSILLLGY